MEKIFGLFFNSTLLGVMTENTFLSKDKEELEAICYLLMPEEVLDNIEATISCVINFNIDAMNCTISADNGIATVDFIELNIIL